MVKMKKHPTLGIMVRSDGLILHPGYYKANGTVYVPEYWTYGCNWKLGYKVIVISGKRYKVHRLIAETFLENPDNLPIIDHIDRNPSNNDISNLRWATYKTNMLNRVDVIAAREKLGLSANTDTMLVKHMRCNTWYKSPAGQKYYRERSDKLKGEKGSK